MTASVYYRRLRDSQRLLLTQEEVRWHLRQPESPSPADIVIDFGCGLQLTPKLMVEMVDVLAALGVSAAAVAGPPWCCGMPVEEDRDGASTEVTRASVRHLAGFQPRKVLQSCGAWWPQTARLRDAGETVPFDLQHLSEFILQALQRRIDSIGWPAASSRRALVHLKAQDATPEERAQRPSLSATDRSVPAILELIPSFEIVGEAEPPSLGAPCQTDDDDHSVLSGLTRDQRAQVSAALAAQGERAGADMIVCAHHRCFQEWGKFGTETMPVRHYISVLAEAMGLARPSRYHTCWSLSSIEEIVDETRPAWRSWGMSRDEAAVLAAQIFPSHPLSRA